MRAAATACVTAPRAVGLRQLAAGVQARGKFNLARYENERRQAPGLPRIDPYAAFGFDPAAHRAEPDAVHGCMGLVARAGGVISAQQIDNAVEVMENRIDLIREEAKNNRKKMGRLYDGYDRSKELKVKIMRRNIGELVPVTRTTLASRLPAHLRQNYGGSSGHIEFYVYPVLQGTSILELEANHPQVYRQELSYLMYLAMNEIGIPCALMPHGRVSERNLEMWQSKGLERTFSRPRSRMPDGNTLLEHAEGDFRLGTPGPRPLYANNTRAEVRFRTPEEEEEYYRRASLERTITPYENSVSPFDVLGKTQVKKWKAGVTERRRLVRPSRFNKNQSCSRTRMKQWKSSRGR